MNHELHVALDDADFLAVFPLRARARAPHRHRARRQTAGHQRARPGTTSAQQRRRAAAASTSRRVNWFSTYRVHHRVADHFRRGRAFLLGDAAHVHSPVGGQGMNTGIGDAVNLAWKLAAVARTARRRRRCSTPTSPSGSPSPAGWSRRPTAPSPSSRAAGALARCVRTRASFPRLLPRLVALRRRSGAFAVPHALADRDQLPRQPPQRGARRARARRRPAALGARGADGDNFAPLASLDWQVHVYGRADAEPAARRAREAGARTSSRGGRRPPRAGLARDALYLVRPTATSRSPIAAAARPRSRITSTGGPSRYCTRTQRSDRCGQSSAMWDASGCPRLRLPLRPAVATHSSNRYRCPAR